MCFFNNAFSHNVNVANKNLLATYSKNIKKYKSKLQLVLLENEDLQNINSQQKQQSETQQDVINELQTKVKNLSNVNVGLQNQLQFASQNYLSRGYLFRYPKLYSIVQQLDLPLTLAGSILIILLLLLWIIHKSCATVEVSDNRLSTVLRTSQAHASQAKQSSEGKNNINYKNLAGEDVVTVKLNLARAYYDMGDFDKAKKILVGVAREGTEQQNQEANALLDKINSVS